MQIRVEKGDLAQHPAKAVIVNLFEEVKRPGGGAGAVDRALGGAISQLIAEGEIKGKKSELTLVHTLGKLPTPRVLVVGLGKQAEFSLDTIRDVTGTALRRLRNVGAATVATIVHGGGIAGLEPEACAQAITEGAVMGLYRFDRLKKPDEDQKQIDSVTLVEFDESKLPALERGVERGLILGQAANHARDMANEPANLFTPSVMAERAQALAKDAGLECQVLERDEMEKMGMGALLGVAAGSTQPPKFIILRHRGDAGAQETIGLVGKGVTFDSGGISMKPSRSMEEMKADMAGGAAVISAVWALAKLQAPVNVTAVVPATENMPSGSATKPGDVLRAMNGKTIEVINTDAEGRLVLADAICYARQEKLSPIIDMATLTGSMQIALGPAATGFMTNDDALAEAVVKAGDACGERMWRFPLIDEYRESLKSTIADIKNTGSRYGGAISAAKFLQSFVDDIPWIHIDTAPTYLAEKQTPLYEKGATGVGTRTLVNLVFNLARSAV